MNYGDIISGTSTSTLLITNGQVAPNGCVTKLEQSILVNTFAPTINGGACNSVTNNAQGQGITYHTISNTNQTQTVPMAITYDKSNTCARVLGSITRAGYNGNLFTISPSQSVGTTSTTSIVNTSDVLLFDFTTLPLTPSCVAIPTNYNEMSFTLERNGVVVYSQNISDPTIGSQTNNVYYTYTVPSGTLSLTVTIDSTVS
jgi:hypothetical protein